MQTTEQNKQVVIRFNQEIIEGGNFSAFNDFISDDVVNHAAPAGSPNGRDSMMYFLRDILKKGFPDLKVEIFDQVCEGDKVVTRKVFHATHSSEIMGIVPSHKQVTIKVIDIIRLEDGKYVEHWGMSNFAEVVAELRQ